MKKQTILKMDKDDLLSMMQEFFQEALTHAQEERKHEPQKTKLLSIKELSKLLRVSQVTLHAWKKSGKIPFKRLGGRIFFDEADVMAAMKDISNKNEHSERKI